MTSKMQVVNIKEIQIDLSVPEHRAEVIRDLTDTDTMVHVYAALEKADKAVAKELGIDYDNHTEEEKEQIEELSDYQDFMDPEVWRVCDRRKGYIAALASMGWTGTYDEIVSLIGKELPLPEIIE